MILHFNEGVEKAKVCKEENRTNLTCPVTALIILDVLTGSVIATIKVGMDRAMPSEDTGSLPS
jgi:hypothetical protein